MLIQHSKYSVILSKMYRLLFRRFCSLGIIDHNILCYELKVLASIYILCVD